MQWLKQRLFGKRRVLTEQKLQDFIEESEQDGVINENEGDMLHSIIEFGDTIVREVMVPRTDMVCCSNDAPVGEFLQAVLDSGHSRIPVYDGNADNIVGIMYAKDLLSLWGQNVDSIDLLKLLRKAYFVPETKNVEELLKEFKAQRVHMAIAVDEYGGTSGLITIEDLIEEIIGDIQDEYDSEEEWLFPDADGSVVVDARLNIEHVEEHFNVELPREKFDTIGGFVVDLLGNVPEVDQSLVACGLTFTILQSDSRRINKMKIEPVVNEQADV